MGRPHNFRQSHCIRKAWSNQLNTSTDGPAVEAEFDDVRLSISVEPPSATRGTAEDAAFFNADCRFDHPKSPFNGNSTTVDTDFDNQLIDWFEDEIRAGESPEIEGFLALCPEDSKQRILLELISIEIFHRIKKGRPVSNSDYGRFGEVGENHS